MNIAVFSDLHGRVLLAFALCARWQRETGQRITAILQAGDLGAYPDVSRLDRATLRHAQRDPDELGFLRDFAEPREDVASKLSQTTCPMIFVRGNHEDHDWLDRLERQATEALFPVDPYQRIYCLRTGMAYTFADDGAQLSVLGIGRTASPLNPNKWHKGKYVQPHELERLNHLRLEQLDILLTHDVPPTHLNGRSQGMAAIRQALDAHQPTYHFYGHTEEPYLRELDRNGVTTAIRMADLVWDRTIPGAPIASGAMGILRWNSRQEHTFEVVDAPWLRDYTADAWRWL